MCGAVRALGPNLLASCEARNIEPVPTEVQCPEFSIFKTCMFHGLMHAYHVACRMRSRYFQSRKFHAQFSPNQFEICPSSGKKTFPCMLERRCIHDHACSQSMHMHAHTLFLKHPWEHVDHEHFVAQVHGTMGDRGHDGRPAPFMHAWICINSRMPWQLCHVRCMHV